MSPSARDVGRHAPERAMPYPAFESLDVPTLIFREVSPEQAQVARMVQRQVEASLAAASERRRPEPPPNVTSAVANRAINRAMSSQTTPAAPRPSTRATLRELDRLMRQEAFRSGRIQS